MITRGRANFIESRTITTRAAEIITTAMVEMSPSSQGSSCLIISAVTVGDVKFTNSEEDKDEFKHLSLSSLGHILVTVGVVRVVLVETNRGDVMMVFLSLGQAKAIISLFVR